MLSSRVLLLMARTWLMLGMVGLGFASSKLFHRAVDAGLAPVHLYWIIPVAIIAGAFKARKVMRKRMRANIKRLAATTEKLWPWHIYPWPLLVFIIAMIVLMAILKRVFAASGPGLGALGGVDLAVGVALGVASLEYRNSAPD